MTQGATNNVNVTNGADHAANRTGTAQVGELLDQVCGNALRVLADTARPPRHLQVRAGEVSLDIEWPEPPGARPAAAVAEELPAAPAVPAEPESGGYLTAHTVGVFYRSPEPGATPFVSEGDTVVAGQQVGIIEAMKLMIPVEADRAGRVAAVLKGDAEPVEYGDRLFALTTVDPS